MNWRKWLDEFALAGKGILLATKEKRFWYGFILRFLNESSRRWLLQIRTYVRTRFPQ